MYEGDTVGVVVPAYNEEGRVGEVIRTIPDFVDRVYVVDDGSTDGTWREIRRHAARTNERSIDAVIADGGGFERRVVPIRHEDNRGVGGAIKTGYLRAREEQLDVTAVLAGDGQMEPDLLADLLDPIVEGRVDYAKGNRLLARSTLDDMPHVRLFGNVVLSILTKTASGYWGIGDSQNGYTAISRRALEAVSIEEMYEFYGYCNDLLVRLNVNDMAVVDVSMPATYGDEESSIDYQSYVPRVATMLLRSFLWRLKVKYLVADFHPLVLLYGLGALGGVAWLLDALRAAVSRNGDTGGEGSLVGVLLSGLAIVHAMRSDRAANDHLVEDPLYPDDD